MPLELLINGYSLNLSANCNSSVAAEGDICRRGVMCPGKREEIKWSRREDEFCGGSFHKKQRLAIFHPTELADRLSR